MSSTNLFDSKEIDLTIGSCSRQYQDVPLKETSMPFPPIPAIKHWNPHDSKSAITLSTTVPDNTEQCS